VLTLDGSGRRWVGGLASGSVEPLMQSYVKEAPPNLCSSGVATASKGTYKVHFLRLTNERKYH